MVVFERAPDSWQALELPFFHPYEVPAAISVAELLATAKKRRQLLATAKKRRQAVVQRVKFMGETGIYGRPFHSRRAGSAIW